MDQQSHTRSQSLRQGNRNYSQRPHSDVAGETPPYRDSNDTDDDEEYDDVWPSRMPSSTRRYRSDVRTEGGYTSGGRSATGRMTRTSEMQAIPPSASRTTYRASSPGRSTTSIPPRRTATQAIPAVQPTRRRTVEIEAIQPRVASQQPRRRPHWLVYAGLAMLGMLIVWILLTSFLAWWQVKMDDLHYGRPRTAQYDVVLSPGDTQANPSHLIVTNLRRHIEIIDCPAGDCSKAKVLTGPVLIGQNQDLAPATLTFKDVNGDGKLDIIVNVQNSHFIFINDKDTFRPVRQSDNVHL